MQLDVSNGHKRRRSRSAHTKTRTSTAEERGPQRRSARLSAQRASEVDNPIDGDAIVVSKRTRALARLEGDCATQHSKELSEKIKRKHCQGLVGSLSRRPSKRRQIGFSCVTSDSVDQENNHSLVCSPLDASTYTLGISKHDATCREDVLRVPEYATDIFHRLFSAEVRTARS